MLIFKHKSKTTKAILAFVISFLVLSGTANSSKTLVHQTPQTELVCLNKSKSSNQIIFYKNTAKYNNSIVYKKDKALALLHSNNLVKVKINQLSRQSCIKNVPCLFIFLHRTSQPSYADHFISITG